MTMRTYVRYRNPQTGEFVHIETGVIHGPLIDAVFADPRYEARIVESNVRLDRPHLPEKVSAAIAALIVGLAVFGLIWLVLSVVS